MNIGKYWRVEADPMNIVLIRKRRTKATAISPAHDIWRVEGYYSNLKNALKALVDFKVKETQLVDFKTIVEKQDDLYSLIETLAGSSTLKQSKSGR